MTATNVIVNADDFGLSQDISDTIARGHDRGIVTSTTLIATASATEHAANLAKRRPSLGVGVHLNITAGRPLSDPGKLAGLVSGDGSFLPPERSAKRLIFDLRLVGPIFEEYSRQVERCLDLGITPTHCDTHHGMHRFPVVFEAFRRTLVRYRIKAARSGVVLVIQARPSANQDGAGPDIGCRWDRGLQATWKRLCARRMHTSGIRTPDALLRADVNVSGQGTPAEWFDSLVHHAPPGTFEIVLHPGMPEEGGHVSSGFLDIRRRDTALVDRSDRLTERLSGTPVRFISYAELARAPR
jgi:chitin disaccharide deacetylase